MQKKYIVRRPGAFKGDGAFKDSHVGVGPVAAEWCSVRYGRTLPIPPRQWLVRMLIGGPCPATRPPLSN
jgi:hypothetical protein